MKSPEYFEKLSLMCKNKNLTYLAQVVARSLLVFLKLNAKYASYAVIFDVFEMFYQYLVDTGWLVDQ